MWKIVASSITLGFKAFTGGVLERLGRLRRQGFRLGLDDFGIGYSTLGFLRDGGFDVLKVDRSFVAAIGSDSPFANLVDRIVEIGLSYDLEVIAEGIESKAEALTLTEAGARYGQGFLFAGPAPCGTSARPRDRYRAASRLSTRARS